MVRFIEGDDIFVHPADYYVITINCIGAMGAGIAKAFRSREPALYQRYRKECREGRFQIGQGAVYHGATQKYILLPTKYNWRHDSTTEMISQALCYLIAESMNEIKAGESIVMSPLGCGNGGLSFYHVSQMIVGACGSMDNPVTVVHPWHQQPHPSLVDSTDF